MRKTAMVAGAAILVLSQAICALPQAAEPALQKVEPPDWARKPTNDEMIGSLPAEAYRQGKDGKAILRCKVMAVGALTDCSVLSEEPKGLGFGRAALQLTPLFMMKPMQSDGRSVEGATVTIPLTWKLFGAGPSDTIRVLSSVPWLEAPSSADVEAAYPARLRGKGDNSRIVLRCMLTSIGALSRCDNLIDGSRGKGLEGAARSLLPKFRADLEGLQAKDRRTFADISFHFVDPASTLWRERSLPKPDWIVTPSAQAAELYYPAKARAGSIRTGRAILACVVTREGSLTKCAVQSEEPVGLGFGEAATKMSAILRMNPWTDEGLPVEGVKVQVPIRLTLPELAPPTPPTTP